MITRRLAIIKSSLLATTFSVLIATPLLSQAVELVEVVGDYQIVKVVSSNVCFAAYNGKSTNEKEITFAIYKTKAGDRWQVAGYVDQKNAGAKGDFLNISFDDETVLFRSIDFSNGKFVLPFTEDTELESFTKRVDTKNTLVLSLKELDDSIVIDLPELRKAREAMENCLAAINE